jgi:response regulator RpfG family c-di-GMP phosphodiesterase
VNQEQQEAVYLRDLINSSLATPAISQLDYLKELYFFHNLYQVTRHISENYDGTGRPSGLAIDRIPLGARIIRVVDYYVSRTDMEIDPETVITELQERSGTLFDPKIVQALLEILASGLGGPHTQ